ncbi:uroporphyrinogen decarboxylase family protein [Robinsoniella sp. KNHs210]|uniref:uroporphyrinogen decarboxylase family protein n=1 Tax=Robinsoniella sp. KNHs210 TaxID=1469950 RepID=UPI000480CFE8|nr:uroporphyrinogen decarboxylase family protein [Robinsoniella sp. KNHs210]
MNSLERFYATVDRKPVDRPAAWLGMPDIFAQPALFEYYGVKDMHELKLAVGDDFYAVEVSYQSPTASAIYAAFDWYMDGNVDSEDRTLTADGCFKDAEDLEDLDFFEWPDPAKYIDVEECRRRVELAPEGKVVLGMMWSAHFQDACASFGMETALMNMIANPEVYEAVNDKIVDFYLKANEIFYEATKGKLNAVLIGNDMGSQRGLMLSPAMVKEFIIPGCKKLVEQAHSYGLKVIYHSCGSIADVIPDLIEAGVDIVHPIQALAAGMQPENLKEKFEGKVSFCGGVDTQDLLVNGTPEEVRSKVKELRTIFPTGLIISPSHEAIMPDVPPANIKALFDEAQKIYG